MNKSKSIQKKFLSSAFLIILLNLLVKPFYLFGIDAQVQNIVGSEEYGLYFSLLNFTFVFNMLLDLGITNFNTKSVAANPDFISKNIGGIVGSKLMLGFLYCFVMIIFGFALRYKIEHFSLLAWLILNQFLAGLLMYLRSNFAGLHFFKFDSFLSILDRTLLIIICGFLIYGGLINLKDFKIEWFVYAQSFSYALAVFIAILLTIYKIGIPRISINFGFAIAILKRSYPYALLVLLMMLYTRIDAVMIERILKDGPLQSGIYAQAFRLLDASNILGLLTAGILLPMFARLLKQQENVESLLLTSGTWLIGTALIFGVSCAFHSKELMSIIYQHNASETAQIFPWVILSFIPICMAYIFGTLMTADGKMRQLNVLAFAAIILNIVLNFIFINRLKAEGAAIATFITQWIAGLGQFYLVFRLYKLSFNFKMIFKFILLFCFLITVGFILPYFSFSNGMFGFLIMIISGFVLSVIIRVINLKQVALLLTNKF